MDLTKAFERVRLDHVIILDQNNIDYRYQRIIQKLNSKSRRKKNERWTVWGSANQYGTYDKEAALALPCSTSLWTTSLKTL